MNWMYDGAEVTELPDGAIGFVYVIMYEDGRRYVGKKLAVSERRLKPLVGQRKNAVRKKTVETKWKSYTGSSKLTEGLVIKEKHILAFCSNNRTMTYLENKYLFGLGVLEHDIFLNENIAGKFWRNCLDGLIK